jgi:rhodanese-related sulfurtransferase
METVAHENPVSDREIATAKPGKRRGHKMLQRTLVSTIVKESLVILLAGTVVGDFLNQGLIRASMNGQLLTRIGQRQMADLKEKAAHIPFVQLDEARRFFNERTAIFVDSRSSADYRESHIQGARGLPLVSLIQNRRLAEAIIPDKTARYIVYCSGGGCDLSVELAKELLSLGYSKVAVLGEGYPVWFEAGYPVEPSR